MKIIKDIQDLRDFTPWSGAVETHCKICDANLGEEFITALEDVYQEGIEEATLNDLLWFEDEFCLHLVGLKTEDELEENDPEEIEE